MLCAECVQASRMPLDEFKDIQRDFVNAMAVCLLEMGGDQNSPAAKRLVCCTAVYAFLLAL